jgi:hypothetical protein
LLAVQPSNTPTGFAKNWTGGDFDLRRLIGRVDQCIARQLSFDNVPSVRSKLSISFVNPVALLMINNFWIPRMPKRRLSIGKHSPFLKIEASTTSDRRGF